jgi:hypothetical protein
VGRRGTRRIPVYGIRGQGLTDGAPPDGFRAITGGLPWPEAWRVHPPGVGPQEECSGCGPGKALRDGGAQGACPDPGGGTAQERDAPPAPHPGGGVRGPGPPLGAGGGVRPLSGAGGPGAQRDAEGLPGGAHRPGAGGGPGRGGGAGRGPDGADGAGAPGGDPGGRGDAPALQRGGRCAPGPLRGLPLLAAPGAAYRLPGGADGVGLGPDPGPGGGGGGAGPGGGRRGLPRPGWGTLPGARGGRAGGTSPPGPGGGLGPRVLEGRRGAGARGGERGGGEHLRVPCDPAGAEGHGPLRRCAGPGGPGGGGDAGSP